jgi:hypothetical protein
MIHVPASKVEFTLGRLQVTRRAMAAIKDSGESAWALIFRHMAGTWDDLTEVERKQNEEALVNGNPITSRFTTAKGVRLVLRTEAEPRLSTTVMLAQEDTSNRSR